MAMSAVQSGPPVWSKLKYLNNYLIDFLYSCTDIHGPQKMNFTDFSDASILILVPSGDQKLALVYDQYLLMSHHPQLVFSANH